jgi:hypothetical protein
VDAIRSFRARFETLEYAADNAFGVLSRADQLGGENDPWAAAAARAEALSTDLSGELATVIPVIGLLAESADHIRESDAAALRELAAALPAEERDWVLMDAESFLEADLRTGVRMRHRLVQLLGSYGLVRALAAVDGGIDTAAAIGKHLEEASGVHAIRSLLFETVASRADAMRAQTALVALESLAHGGLAKVQDSAGPDDLSTWLPDAVERLQIDPTMHRLAELHAVRAIGEHAEVHGELMDDVSRIATGVTAAWRVGLPENAERQAVAARASERHAAWRTLVADPATSPTVRRLAQVFARSYAIVVS